MNNISGTSEEAYPVKRAYFQPKLSAFLKENGHYERALELAKSDKDKKKWNKDLTLAFSWFRTDEGYVYWEEVQKEFERS